MDHLMLESTTAVALAFALAMGLAAGLCAWVVSKSMAEVPEEDRQYKDPPPLGFRLVWWPIQWVASLVEPLMGPRSQAASSLKLRKGGLDYCLSPAQFLASRLVCAAAVAAFFGWIVASFDQSRVVQDGFGSHIYFQVLLFASLFGYAYPAIWLRDRLAARKRELLKSFPFYLDLITLCVEAGLNLQGAVSQAVAKGPKGALRDELQRVLRDIRAGKSRAESLRAMADRVSEPAVSSFTITVIQAESMGMNLGPVLRAQADQRRAERFARAEKAAMEAPVKMLFPLIFFIFPCTFFVLFFPIVMKFMNSGL
jgi:tight adherence protein C